MLTFYSNSLFIATWYNVGVSFLECSSSSIINHLVNIMNELGGFDDVQILGAIKSGPAGVVNINRTFYLNLTSAMLKLEEWNLAETVPVIYTVNDYDRELYNGSLGYVKKVLVGPTRDVIEGTEPTRIICDFEGREISMTDTDLGNLDLAYAITIHKAQGSQFKRVVIPVTKSRLLDRALIYTALTRGIEQVVFIGDKRAFDEVVVRPPSVNLRKVGFSI